MPRPVLLGIDSGTQSTKALAIDAETGTIIAEGRGAHSGNSVQDPAEWWAALKSAVAPIAQLDLDIQGMAISGQQHGCVLIDESGGIVRPASLWNDTSAAPDAERLNESADFADEVGSRLVAAFTIAKLAHFQRTEPTSIERATAVGLPHDWLNMRLTGRLVTDRGDASGSGWWSLTTGVIRRDLLALAIGDEQAHRIELPAVHASDEPAGVLLDDVAEDLGLRAGVPVGPGTGDNMAASLGIGAEPGEFVISLGTSGTAYAVSERPTHDRDGVVCGFADATGRFLPLVCLLNCTRTVDAIAALGGFDSNAALDRAAMLEPGAGGLLLEPWFSGERTPNLPNATATLRGMTLGHLSPAHFARAAVDAVAAGLAFGIDRLRAQGIEGNQITLVGGGSQHVAWQQTIADATELTVVIRGGREHAARGAALQIGAIMRGIPVAEMAAARRPPISTTPRSARGSPWHSASLRSLMRAV